MSTPNTPVRPPRVLTRSFPLYLPHLPNTIRVAIGLYFDVQTHPYVRPYMRFLFVRPEFCPLGDLSTPKIRLSSDSTSRWTPLPLASPSRYRADSGLSPYRTCAHRAHMKTGGAADLAPPVYNITRQASARRCSDHAALAGLVDGRTTAGRPSSGSL